MNALGLIVISVAYAVAQPAQIEQLQAQLDRNPADFQAWVALGHALEEAGREGDAIRAYSKAGELPEAHQSLARLLQFDDPKASIQHLQAAISLHDKAGESAKADMCRRELVRHACKRDKRLAIKAMEQLLDRDPSETLARDLPELFERCGRPVQLENRLRQLAVSLPNAAGAQIALAAAEVESGAKSQAEDRLKALVVNKPNADAYQILARIQVDSPRDLLRTIRQMDGEDDDRARAIIDGISREPAAVEAIAPHLVAWITSTQSKLDPQGILVSLAERADKTELAARLLKQATLRPQVFAALLRLYERQGQYAAIEELTRQWLGDKDNAPEFFLHRYRAIAFMHLGREKEAIAAADKALELTNDRGKLDTQLLRIQVLHWFGRNEPAREASQRALEEISTPKDERIARLRLASLSHTARDDAIADGHLRRVLELDPRDPTAHNDLGYYWAERGQNLAEAERMCRIAVGGQDEEGEPGRDNPAFLDSLGWVLFRQGRLTAARIELERALAAPLGTRDAVIWEHLGDVHWAHGKLGEARLAWREAQARVERSRRSRDDRRPEDLKNKLAALERRMKE